MTNLTQQTLDDFVATIRMIVDDEDRVVKELEVKKKATRESARKSIASAVKVLAPLIDGNEHVKTQVIAYLYWQVEKMPVGTIAELFGSYQVGVMTIAQKWQLHDIVCSSCGERLVLNSRADLASHRRWSTRKCDKCHALERETSNAELKAILAARQARFDELHTMPYKQYLQSDEWASIRTRKLKRARFRCELCNKAGKLNVHHKTYERRGYEDDKDLIVLCGTCHAKFHDKLPPEE